MTHKQNLALKIPMAFRSDYAVMFEIGHQIFSSFLSLYVEQK